MGRTLVARSRPATERLPTLERKLRSTFHSADGGQLGPLGVTPRVLLTVPSAVRLAAAKQ
jgi:hypothetical protein